MYIQVYINFNLLNIDFLLDLFECVPISVGLGGVWRDDPSLARHSVPSLVRQQV